MQYTILYCSVLTALVYNIQVSLIFFSKMPGTVLQYTFVQLRGLLVSTFLHRAVLYYNALYGRALPVVRATFEHYTVEWRGHITIITLHLIAQIAL